MKAELLLLEQVHLRLPESEAHIGAQALLWHPSGTHEPQP